MKTMRNSVSLIGNLGRDPEVKKFEKTQKATFTLATTDQYKNQKGETIKETQWHNIVLWGKLAELAGKFLRKGNLVALEGKLVHRAYETEGGEKRYYTEITANDFVLMQNKPE